MNNIPEQMRRLMRKKQTWLVCGIILIIAATLYFLMAPPQNGSSPLANEDIQMHGIIAITLVGCLLLLIVTVLLIKDHHLYRYENERTYNKKKQDQLKDQKKTAVIITNATGVITYMNKMAQQIIGYTHTKDPDKALEDVYRLQNDESRRARTVWKAIPGSEGMMTEKEMVWLVTPPQALRISQQVFHFFDNKGEMKEKVIAFTPEKVSSGSLLSPDESAGAVPPVAMHYAQIAGINGDICWEWDIEQCVMLCSSEHPGKYGYKESGPQSIRQWWRSNIHPEDGTGVQACYTRAIEERKSIVQQEYRFRFADGKFRHILDRATVICDETGEPVRLAGVMQDISWIKQEEKRLTEAVLNAQEAERKAIGAELHDNINQVLATAVLHLSLIHEQAPHPEKVRDLVRSTKSLTMRAVDEIRKLSHELSPVSLDDTDLEEYIRDLLSSFNADEHFDIDFNFEPQVRESLTDEMQLHFYRILQEQLKNIRKHAGADRIFISIALQQNFIELIIADNGKGFDPLIPSKGIGLANIKRRAHLMGGCVSVKSEPRQGSRVRVKVLADV